MFVVELNRENFEYDVNSIVKAFYPETQVAVLTPASGEKKRAEYGDKVRIRVEFEENGAELEMDGRSLRWEAPAVSSGRAADAESDGSGDAEAGAEESSKRAKAYKDGFKRFLYELLVRETGKELPWGNLTGIRPTKIAYGMLEQGTDEEQIVEYYQKEHFVSGEKARLSVDIAKRERRLLSQLNCEEGYSLYIGIPFCPTTCLYCSFTSFPIGGCRGLTEPYVDCLIKEMEYVAEQYGHRAPDTVYIGGGTPTTLEPKQLNRLLGRLRELFDLDAVKEFTVEAGRADSITEEKLRVLRQHGVTRISVNPQTMKQETLDIIGRRASVAQVEEAYAMARRMGFDNINMDLILGLPGESEEDVQRTVDRVAELAPDSLTVHSLAIKRASKLNRWILENGDVAGARYAMLRNTDETMKIAAEGARRLGLLPYYLYRQKNMSGNFENVGYAKEDKAGLYNILIMEEVQTIVALGAGSISKRVYPDGRIERCENVKEVALYIEKIDEMIGRKRELFMTNESE